MEEILVGAFVPSGVSLDDIEAPKMAGPWRSSVPWFGQVGVNSDSGITVTPGMALQHTPLWHGLTLLGGDVGSLPLELKSREGDRISNVTNHVAIQLAGVRPNMLMCPSSFWETTIVVSILYGNALAKISRSDAGVPLPVNRGGGLQLLPPENSKPWFDETGKLWIESFIVLTNGQRERKLTDPDDVLHIPSLTTDGYWGRGIIDVGRNRLGFGLGIEKQGNRFMRNGMQPSWLFSYPMHLGPERGAAIEERLQRHNAGVENAGRNLVLDNGVKAEQLGMSFESAQFVELQKMDVKMVASLLGIPAVMLNAMDQMTFSNAEESERWYINRTLRRWLNKITQECAAKLLTDRERNDMFFKFDLSPLLMGRLQERMSAYGTAIAARILSPNEVRQKEGLNPYDGGDEYANPNTSSGAVNRHDTATRLRPLLKREDYEVSEACRREDNVVQWLDAFYRESFLNELLEIAPNCAGEYCEGRHKLWLKMANHVSTPKALGEIVKAQGQTVTDRLAGILNAEFVAA